MDAEHYGYNERSFKQKYRCYPVSYINKPHLENGDKIIMPQSALDHLSTLHIYYPMLFKLYSPSSKRTSHCSVLEFTAEEGMVFLPNWMMRNMLLSEGDIAIMENVSLPKGTYMKLQPHTMNFLDITDPKAVLERNLRNFSCLTIGDTIMVAHNNQQYYIDIVETKPSNAITIIDTDCEVDFAPPLDYKQPETAAPKTSSSISEQDQQKIAKEETTMKRFVGVGRRLDGKAIQPSPAPSSSASKVSKKDSSTQTSPPRELVYGSSSNTSRVEKKVRTNKASEGTTPQKKEEPSFNPFTGKKYSLLD